MQSIISYEYLPDGWNQKKFFDLGGYTVVFLNYNKGSYIEESVQSVLAQNYPLLEMFFMDDASTDGSGDRMERIVRSYRGRHKLTVVRNQENKNICGQWNAVARLAKGNWFGMFCADDFAKPDRVSMVAEIISRHPTLLGVCTDLEDRLEDGSVVAHAHVRKEIYGYGSDSLESIIRLKYPIIGASTFWHKSLFDKKLPNVPLDDVLLRCILQVRASKVDGPIWVWLPGLITVTYNKGGISTTGEVNVSSMGFISAYITSKDYAIRMAKLWAKSLEGVESYLRENDVLGRWLIEMKAARMDKQIFAKEKFFWRDVVCVLLSIRISFWRKAHIVYTIFLRWCGYLFGLRFEAAVACMMDKLKRLV